MKKEFAYLYYEFNYFISLGFMEPKVIIQRIDNKFLLDYLQKQESVPEESKTIVLRRRKSISIIEIETPKKRRHKKSNSSTFQSYSNEFYLIISFYYFF